MKARSGPSAGTSLRELIGPDERLLWEGRPDKRTYVLRGSWFLLPFSVLWGGFAIYWEYLALTHGAPPMFALFGVPFVALGLYLILGRFWVAAREADRTTYGLTDRRVLIQTGALNRRLIDLPLANLPAIEFREGRSGFGTIVFGQPVLPFFWTELPGWPGMPQMAAFVAISDAAEVYRLVRRARDEAVRGGA